MRSSFPLFLLLIAGTAFAQPNQRPNYSGYDSCPDPVVNRISQRTIYVSCGDPVMCRVDTTIEKYNTKGQLFSITSRSDTRFSIYNNSHYLEYDSLGRITRDTGLYEPNSFVSTTDYLIEYEYPTPLQEVARLNLFGKKSSITKQYNRDNSILSSIQIDDEGNVLKRVYKKADTLFIISFIKYVGRPIQLVDSSYVVSTKRSVFSYSSSAAERRGPPTTIHKLYDRKGRLKNEVSYGSNGYCIDSVVYSYNKENQLTLETQYRALDGDTFYTKYVYQNDVLIEWKSWSTAEPETVYYYRYSYNENGLRTKFVVSSKYRDETEQMIKTEVWEYQYW